MVYQILVAPESYTRWTSAFGEGLYLKGSWQKGQTIRFMTSGGDGVISDIAENRPNEFISLRHFGYIVNGAEDTSSEAIRSWAPAYENYTFTATPPGTKLTVDQDITDAPASHAGILAAGVENAEGAMRGQNLVPSTPLNQLVDGCQ
jgi:hypothetical protein